MNVPALIDNAETLVVGARLLARKQAIVSKLVALEELAGVNMPSCGSSQATA